MTARAGLRVRITALFALVALGVSAALALGTYSLTRSSLVLERERTAVRGTYYDAAAVRSGLSAEDPQVVDVLRALDTGTNRRPLLRRDGRWYARAADDGSTSAVPATLQRMAEAGKPGLQRVRVGGDPVLIVAVPLPDVRATYYELNDLTELSRTLRSLEGVLALLAIGTALAGAALGWWAAQRVLRPLASVTDAATLIASGNLHARLDPAKEPEIAALSASFNTMVDELSSRLERDRRFAADVSHELRSPLQTLSAAADILDRRRDRLDERTGAAVGLLTTEVARFQELVTDLLQLARGDRPAERVPTDVAALVAEVARRYGVHPEVAPSGPVTALVDPPRLRQAVVNLLENAQRHGGGVLAVRVIGTPTCVAVEVDDDGPGVPEEERQLVFDRFARGRAASARRESEGTGLGLALVRQHVEAHDGRVLLLDRPGGGARFRLELPR